MPCSSVKNQSSDSKAMKVSLRAGCWVPESCFSGRLLAGMDRMLAGISVCANLGFG